MKTKQQYLRIISVLFLLFPGIMSAQETMQEDVVYLKNGSVMHGTILEMVPGKSLKLKTYDGNVFAYKMIEVEKTVKEDVHRVVVVKEEEESPKPSSSVKQNSKPSLNQNTAEAEEVNTPVIGEKFHPENFFSIETGYLGGVGDITFDNETDQEEYNFYGYNETVITPTPNQESGYFIRSKYAIPVTRNFYIGGGIEMDFYQSKTLMPFSLDLKLSFGESKAQPFLNLSLGHAVSTGTEEGGFMFDLSCGAKINTAQGHGFAFGFSYRSQNSDFKYTNGTEEVFVPATAHYMALTLGYVL